MDIRDDDFLFVCSGKIGNTTFNAFYTDEENNNTIGRGYVQKLALWDRNYKLIFQLHERDMRVPPANEDIRYTAQEVLKKVNYYLNQKFKEDK